MRLVGGETLSVTQMSNDPERLTEFLMEHYGSFSTRFPDHVARFLLDTPFVHPVFCAVAGEQTVEDQLRHARGLSNVKDAKGSDYRRGTLRSE